MQRRNPLFHLTAIDPDKEPTVARTNGIRIYNAAMIEADGRRVLVQSTDEAEIALGSTRAARCAITVASSKATASCRWTTSSSTRISKA